ncbi:uncharacterized protein LOC120634755 [Pararge aegeria]|uniref:uncharacterized protein LOC120634755 n=1 Tax=Pararge aegeria TaxID=116150 RepID=UPI0019CFE156|nr:uncharacterized protein LOC120634755 [Pararge aegeria]
MNERHISVLQANLNHCAGAQDLLLQSAAGWSVDLVVACEPYYVPTQERWVGDMCGSVVIVAANGASPPLSPLERGPGFVVVGWGPYTVVGLYFSSNRTLAEFEISLTLSAEPFAGTTKGAPWRWKNHLGDFNAKSQAWGSPTSDGRGRAVLVWATHLGLSLLNRGTAHTCVRAQGGYIVDLSFASPSVADRVANWRVEDGVETLSDHNYVRFEVSTSPVAAMVPPQGPNRFPRWCLT